LMEKKKEKGFRLFYVIFSRCRDEADIAKWLAKGKKMVINDGDPEEGDYYVFENEDVGKYDPACGRQLSDIAKNYDGWKPAFPGDEPKRPLRVDQRWHEYLVLTDSDNVILGWIRV